MNSRTGDPRAVRGGRQGRRGGPAHRPVHRTRTTIRTTGGYAAAPRAVAPSGEGVPRGFLPGPARHIAVWSALTLLVTGVVYVGVWICVTFQTAVTPVLIALLGTALLGPFYRRLVAMRFNKSLAAGLTCAAVMVVMGGAAYIVVAALIDTGDQIISSLRQAAKSLSDEFGLAGTSLDDLAKNARELLPKFGGTAASGVLTGVSAVSEFVAAAVLAMLLMFFFLRDSDRAVASLHSLAPRGSGDTLEVMARRAFRAIEGYMRGTTLIAFIDGVCIAVGLLILQVPGAVGLGALVFVGAYIPYLGAFLSGAVAILVAFADRGLVTALWAVGVVFAVQLLEGNVLQPMIHSRTVQMHPAAILLALTAGASIAGILGMLLAVPLTAAVSGVLSELRSRYGDGAGPAVPPAEREIARAGG
ncbi:AI-2E family transporter [Streptomyces stelliscabiei]|uniref:Putative PurR-regulated permease PerM n=1 Tax=Streptomyces stelliscabiei TaxID=146820 RepID=A0A8I0P980_9ACTN|nr:putative PurR-regulated permease PerM [Streptomyces stelliscabiei]SOD69535.1 Predicted PurR-regulated permease PerM [Streptomyces sp. 1222.2]MDX2522439.1 AI-2E family transporter [Streptomyces stelliscabiei]MDX2554334.1 AI-2E family transporter [Streptomyces stelliscabiei]MDX2613543.1 AI-2E family transporter [Streptomyces stelliscabiei]